MKYIIKLTFIFLTVGIFFSCAPTKKSAYFQEYKEIHDINISDKTYHVEDISSEYIKTGDELYITVVSGNDSPNSFNQSTGSNETEFMAYVVNNEGNIRLPYLHDVKAEGLTLSELANNIETELAQYIYLPAVSIRIISKRVTVLGEVRNPGLYIVNQASLNIYQAIGLAGDLTNYGNRKKVLIVRKEGNSIEKKYVNLTNDQIITSSWYNIQPDDIIYVEPLFRKAFGTETFSIFSLFSLITSTYAIYLLISSL